MKNFLLSNNLLAEKKLIGWMSYKKEFVDISEMYLYNTKIRKFYCDIKTQFLKSGTIDPELLTEHQDTYIECLDVETPSSTASIVAELEKHYKVRQFALQLIESVENLKSGDDIDGVIVDTSAAISRLYTNSSTIENYNHKQSVLEYIADVKKKMDIAGSLKGIRSNLPKLDEIINGWQHGIVYLVSGLEKLGKSRFVRSLASKWLNDGLGGIFFMLEEDCAAIHESILSNRTRINSSVIGTQKISPMELAKLCKSTEAYGEQNLYICNKSNMTAEYIKAVVTQVKNNFVKKGGTLDFVIIDYVQRLDDPAENLNEKAENLSRKIADITRDEKLITIEISQLLSGAERTKAPVHTQLRFGKYYKEAAGCIISFDDPERMGENTQNNALGKILNCHILQRGNAGNVIFKIFAELQYSDFSECTQREEFF